MHVLRRRCGHDRTLFADTSRTSSSTVLQVLDHEEIVRLYGPWVSRTPQDAAALFEGYGDVWWWRSVASG